MKSTLLYDKLAQSMSYEQYLELIDELLAKGLTTGPKQSEAMTGYTSLNQRRMNRLDKTASLDDELIQQVQSLSCSYTWLVITEAWCGDAAQIIPWLNIIAKATDRIDLRLILRDDHPELIDQYQTNGARSIPILICIDNTTGKEIGTWGPRPAPAQQMLIEYMANPNRPPYSEFSKDLQLWYARDKGRTLQWEVSAMIKSWACAKV